MPHHEKPPRPPPSRSLGKPITHDDIHRNSNLFRPKPLCPHWPGCRYTNIIHSERAAEHMSHFFHASERPAGHGKCIPLAKNHPVYCNIEAAFVSSMAALKLKARVTAIQCIQNEYLQRKFQERVAHLRNKHKGTFHTNTILQLYHGTAEAAIDSLIHNGFRPPADYCASPDCPVSKVLSPKSPSLCDSNCMHCTTKRHQWDQCHMYGLGVYFADAAHKSDRYVKNRDGKKDHASGRKMLLCDVHLGKFWHVDAQLGTVHEMHDQIIPPGRCDSTFVSGVGSKVPYAAKGQLAVMHNEYVVFHPYQALPRYIIEYDKL